MSSLPTRLAAGTTIRIESYGIYSTPLLTIGSLTAKIKLGSTVLTGAVMNVLLGGASHDAWDFSCLLACRTTGSTGTLAPTGKLNFSLVTGASVRQSLTQKNDVTIDTAAANTLDVTLQWGVASATRSVTSRSMVVSLIN